ncbi:MAG: pentapeptide repeat-containing protein [Halanaeroarchaeum sp.]
MTEPCSFTLSPDDDRGGDFLDGTWSCPHDAVAGSDRCAFHLDPERRESLGIDEEAVHEAFESAVAAPGQRSKEVFGARLNGLSLEYAVLDAPDRYPIRLAGSTVDGTLRIQETTVAQPLDLAGARIESLAVRDAEFEGPVTLTGADLDDVVVEGVEFDRRVEADALQVAGDVAFDETRFYGDASFDGLAVEGTASFRGAEFHGEANVKREDASFVDARVDGDVDFRDTTFRNADFGDFAVGGEGRFEEVTFEGDATFTDAVFDGAVAFVGAEFRGGANVERDDANFDGVTFGGPVRFVGTRFRYASFDGATFAAECELEDARFDREASFEDADVRAEAVFDEARFTDDTSFEESQFRGPASFRGVEFQGGDNVVDEDVTFAGAVFEAGVDFERAIFEFADFEGVRVEGDLRLDSCSFGDRSIFRDVAVDGALLAPETRFDGDASFEGAFVDGAADFAGAEFRGGDNVGDDDVTFANAEIHGSLTLERGVLGLGVFDGLSVGGEARFEGVSLADDATFEEAVFEGPARFDEARFDDDVSFADAAFRDEAVFAGAEFHGGANVRERDLDFSGVTVSGSASFEHAQFRLGAFTDATFEDAVSFEKARFDGDAVFEDVTVEGEANFAEIRCHRDTTVSGATFREAANFQGAEFHGGANVVDTDFDAEDATFDDDVRFDRAEFGFAVLEGIDAGGDVSVREATFTDRALLSGITVAGATDFVEATFEQRTDFAEGVFEGRATFDQAEFHSNVSFEEVTFGAEASFEGTAMQGSATVLQDDADFRRASFQDDVSFEKAEFRYGNFSRADFAGDATFRHAFFDIGGAFEAAQVGGAFSAADARFEGDVTFDRIEVRGPADFEETEFAGESNVHGRGATFDDAAFHDAVSFERAEFQTAAFEETAFADPVAFTDAVVRESLVSEIRPLGDQLVVDMGGTALEGGRIAQPPDGATYYDLTGATVGQIEFAQENAEHEVFDYFRLSDTTFEGFDFSAHMDELSRNDWIIHRFGLDDEALPGDVPPVDDPGLLETTYLKAKNSADAFGHRKAAAEFFIKELTYRRKKNWSIFRGAAEGTADGPADAGTSRAAHADDPTGRENPTQTRSVGAVRERAGALGRWFGNYLLYQTSGYGERLWRVIYISAVVVVTWAFLFTTLSRGTRGPAGVTTAGLSGLGELLSTEGVVVFGKNLYFSLVTFTTLGYGDIQPIGAVARLLASIESFIGALLVALVVFVLGRRVAW